MKKTILILTLFLLTSLVTFGQSTDNKSNQLSSDEETITKLEKEYTQAFVKGDEKTLRRLISDDYKSTDSEGNKLSTTKGSIIQALKSSGVKYLTYETDELNINIEGNTATVKGRLSKRLLRNSAIGLVEGKYIRTWTKKNNSWQITNYQAATSAKTIRQGNTTVPKSLQK